MTQEEEPHAAHRPRRGRPPALDARSGGRPLPGGMRPLGLQGSISRDVLLLDSLHGMEQPV